MSETGTILHDYNYIIYKVIATHVLPKVKQKYQFLYIHYEFYKQHFP